MKHLTFQRISVLTIVILLVAMTATTKAVAQNKIVLLDISHGQKNEYTDVNHSIFDQYKEIVENKLSATLIINDNKELSQPLLAQADVLIILAPLNKTTLKNLTTIERESVVDYVKNGGKLILFTDEDKRMDIKAFGANDIIEPFGMHLGSDLPYKRDVMAISIIGEVIKGKYELPYSGSLELTGGIPLSIMNAEGGHIHGAYTKLKNGGKLVAFGETMVGLFMGGVEMKMPDGSSFTWSGKDDKQYMLELIDWALQE